MRVGRRPNPTVESLRSLNSNREYTELSPDRDLSLSLSCFGVVVYTTVLMIHKKPYISIIPSGEEVKVVTTSRSLSLSLSFFHCVGYLNWIEGKGKGIFQYD